MHKAALKELLLGCASKIKTRIVGYNTKKPAKHTSFFADLIRLQVVIGFCK